MNVPGKKLYYYWSGFFPAKPGESYEGFGEISFHDSPGRAETAVALHSQRNLADASSGTKKSYDFRRCTDDESKVMHGSDIRRMGALLAKKLKQGQG